MPSVQPQPDDTIPQEPWNLGLIYPSLNDPKIAADQSLAETTAKTLGRFRGRIHALDASEMLTLLEGLEVVRLNAWRPWWFASLQFYSDSNHLPAKQLLDTVRVQATNISNLVQFAHLELGALTGEQLARYQAMPELHDYRYTLERSARNAPHQLSEPEELVLNQKMITGRSAWQQLYSEISTRLRVKIMVDGEEKSLTVTEARALRDNADRDLRKRSYAGVFQTYADDAHVLTFIFNTVFQDWAQNTTMRHFEAPIAASVHGDELEQGVVDALLQTTTANYSLGQRYYRYKAKRLGLEPFFSYDILAPVEHNRRVYGFAESKTLVLDAFKTFDARYAKLAQQFFDESRIDVPPRDGKRGGAYCWGLGKTEPVFIALNFLGSHRDLSTLAHELGHGIHSELAKTQNASNAKYTRSLAETASTFSEILLANHLLQQDPGAARVLLCEELEDVFSTVFRQVQITRWEQRAHAERAKGVVTAERYGEIWLEEMQRHYGDTVTPIPEDAWGWVVIPHVVQTPFYCYSYSFGNLLVYALYQRYLQEGAAFTQKYMAFLEAGQSKSPVDLVAGLGLDLRDPGFWQLAFDYLGQQLDKLEALDAQ